MSGVYREDRLGCERSHAFEYGVSLTSSDGEGSLVAVNA